MEIRNRPAKNVFTFPDATRAALGFKAFYSAHATLQGAELIQIIRKGQVPPILGGGFDARRLSGGGGAR